MSNTYVIAGLLDHIAQLKGSIAVLEGKIARERADLAHVEATLRMFKPDYAGKYVKPKRPAPPRSTFFAMGEISARCRAAMRESTGPVSSEEIARKAMADKGLDPEDGKIRSDMLSRIGQALHRMAKEGTVQRVGSGVGVRWALADK